MQLCAAERYGSGPFRRMPIRLKIAAVDLERSNRVDSMLDRVSGTSPCEKATSVAYPPMVVRVEVSGMEQRCVF